MEEDIKFLTQLAERKVTVSNAASLTGRTYNSILWISLKNDIRWWNPVENTYQNVGDLGFK